MFVRRISTSAARWAAPSSTPVARSGASGSLSKIVQGAIVNKEAAKKADASPSSFFDNALESMRAAPAHGSVMGRLSRGELLSPHQLAPEYLLNTKRRTPDVSRIYPLGPPRSAAHLDRLLPCKIDPLEAHMNPYIPSSFVTSMGKIKSRTYTGLQRKSQRKVGKAIRRARAMGLMSPFGVSLPSNY